jgi:hypothetical protein
MLDRKIASILGQFGGKHNSESIAFNVGLCVHEARIYEKKRVANTPGAQEKQRMLVQRQ